MDRKTNQEKKESLINALKLCNSVQQMMDTAYEIIGNPIGMNDMAYNLIANTRNEVTDDPLWNELTTLGTFSHETVDFFKTVNFIDAYNQSDVVAPMISEQLKYDRANGKLFDEDGVQIANVIVVACQNPFEEGDYELIEILCEFLSLQLQKSKFVQKGDRVFGETFITELIEGRNTDKDRIDAWRKEVYPDLKANCYVAVVDIIQYEHTLTHLEYFRRLFGHLQSEYRYFIHLNNVVILISTDNPTLNIQRDLNSLNDFFKKYRLFAGVSHGFKDLSMLRKYYKQALNALNYGMESNSGQAIFMYGDHMAECLINQIKDHVDIWEFLHPLVVFVKEHDKKYGSVYYDILRIFLISGRNPQIASEALKMDPDAFQDKLREMEELFEIDWNNGNMLLNIYISLKMLDCFPDRN